MFRSLLTRMNAIPTPKLVNICVCVLVADTGASIVDYWFFTKRHNALRDASSRRDRS